MKNYIRSEECGFTLIESVVSLLILGIVSVVIISLNSNLFLRSDDMRSLQQSSQLLQACVDQVIALRKTSGYAGPLHCDELNALPTGFNLNVSLKATPDHCPSGLECKQVLVSVNKTGGAAGNPVSLLFVNY